MNFQVGDHVDLRSTGRAGRVASIEGGWLTVAAGGSTFRVREDEVTLWGRVRKIPQYSCEVYASQINTEVLMKPLNPREETLMKVVSLLEYRRFVDGLEQPEGPPEEWLSPRLATDSATYGLPLQEIVDYIWK